jgi:hypothetical protein
MECPHFSHYAGDFGADAIAMMPATNTLENFLGDAVEISTTLSKVIGGSS